ncbi:MAG TPA: hypothetical protein VFQ66_09400 [Candidatus Limnocylindria bacterium]|nr:hypothetical protein [Candidatus Limnocylindria bacterium]
MPGNTRGSDGVAAATGMLFDVRPVAGLGNGSVVKKFRGRGIQSATIVHRMRAGWDLGWRLLYAEVDWVRSAR